MTFVDIDSERGGGRAGGGTHDSSGFGGFRSRGPDTEVPWGDVGRWEAATVCVLENQILSTIFPPKRLLKGSKEEKNAQSN